MDNPFAVGETFTATFAFTDDNIAASATLLGDRNPIHHAVDPEFGALVAYGGQIGGLLMSFAAATISVRVPAGSGGRGSCASAHRCSPAMRWRWNIGSRRSRGTLLTLTGRGTVVAVTDVEVATPQTPGAV